MCAKLLKCRAVVLGMQSIRPRGYDIRKLAFALEAYETPKLWRPSPPAFRMHRVALMYNCLPQPYPSVFIQYFYTLS